MDAVKTLAKTAGLQDYISSAAEIIEEARAGRIFILVDDEDRENEGDLVIPAQFATPDAINFMIKHARGLVCLAMTKSRCEALGLPLMTQANGTRHETAFTISIADGRARWRWSMLHSSDSRRTLAGRRSTSSASRAAAISWRR